MSKITVKTIVKVPLTKTWEYWTSPEHITKWNFASDDWECTRSTNDLEVGGKFSSTMAAKDGSFSFDFEGIYTYLEKFRKISYKLSDDRRVDVMFEEVDDGVEIIEIFDAEEENPIEMQQTGWQAILDNFKKHVESEI